MSVELNALISKYRGCIFGLAIGDALGAPVEFLSLEEIKQCYGKDGVDDFYTWDNFKPGSYTDDTQMSLATAVGCIRAYHRMKEIGACHPATIVYKCYLRWLELLNDIDQKKFPGNTCLSALRSGKMGTFRKKINNSKGSGGVMRTAPAGLAFPPKKAFREGAEFAAITHGHPSGYLPAGFLSEMISRIIEGETLKGAIELCIKELVAYEGHGETLSKIQLARELFETKKSVEESIQEIGQGWTGEEALAIAIYCSIKFLNDWKTATLTAVNHSGDSDSTGSITGAILGTLLGIESIPEIWIKNIEDSDKLVEIADDMFKVFKKGEVLSFEKYPPE